MAHVGELRVLCVINVTMAILTALIPETSRSAECEMGEPAVAITLYFGLTAERATRMSAESWNAFEKGVLEPNFPDGITVIRGRGSWLDPETLTMSRDPTNVVHAVVRPQPGMRERINAIARSYRMANPSQKTIGAELRPTCADFNLDGK